MISRLAPLALAGTLALTGEAGAADTTKAAVDTYLAITGTGANAISAPAGDPAADGLTPLEPRVFAFGTGTAFVHYELDEERADLVHVVTIVVMDFDGSTAPVRFVSHLAPGQRAEVSVADPDADAAGLETPSLDLAYDGGFVTVRPGTTAQVDG